MVTAMAITGIWFAKADAEWYLYVVAAIVANAYIEIAMVHNDIIDLEIDTINAPERPLPSGRVSMREAKIFLVVLFVIGTTAGLLLWIIEAIIIMVSTLVLSLL